MKAKLFTVKDAIEELMHFPLDAPCAMGLSNGEFTSIAVRFKDRLDLNQCAKTVRPDRTLSN